MASKQASDAFDVISRPAQGAGKDGTRDSPSGMFQVASRQVPRAIDVILRDGRTLRLRPPHGADAAGLLAFFHGLSQESLRYRFHGLATIDERLLQRFVDPDGQEVGAIIGELEGRIVALASWARLRKKHTAEVAFAVADELQGLGVGTRLLEQLAALAAESGIVRFIANVMAGNRAMLTVFKDAGFETARELEGGEVEVRFPIAPTERFRECVDERDHIAVRASLRPFFEPRTVAVIGAAQCRSSVAGQLFRNLIQGDFVGTAYLVSPDDESVAGVRAYRDVADIPEDIDLTILCVPAANVLAASEAALKAGVRALCVISAGFAETGAPGAERQERLLALVRAYGARLIGPNCLGITVAAQRLNATLVPRMFPAGRIGFSSQSGALGIALLEAAAARGLGLSSFVSIGNKADVSPNDLLEWWEDDSATELVLLYVESFGNPRKFARLARRVSRRKPVLALKSGTTRSGARAASSHTAALADSETAVAALFRQAGVLRARTLEELLDVAALLSSQPAPAGRRVGVLTNAGGLGILCADACESAGLELPTPMNETIEALAAVLPQEASLANPIDMVGSATPERYERALPLLLADPRLDAVIVLFVPSVTGGAEAVAEAIRRAVPSRPKKPVLACIISASGVPQPLKGGAIATFAYPDSAANALGRVVERAEWLRRPAGIVPELTAIDREAAKAVVAGDNRTLGAAETRALLRAYGIPVLEERTAASTAEAIRAAAALGYPVVIKPTGKRAHAKAASAAFDVRDAVQVCAAVERLGTPVLVQPMVRDGIELLAGVVQDPVFGPLVAIGLGGAHAELMNEVAFRIAPLTDTDAAELVSTGKVARLIAGYHDARPADAGALEDLLHRLSRLGDDLPEVAELDLNPVIAGPSGYVVADARVCVSSPERAARVKTW